MHRATIAFIKEVRRVDWDTVIDETIRYMEAHLLHLRSVHEVARHVHLSPIYLQQAFHIMTGLTLGAYLRNRKLYLAAMELICTQRKIVDIALDFGYETPESFSKAFTRFHHATPSQVRKNPSLARRFLPINIHIEILGGDDSVQPPLCATTPPKKAQRFYSYHE